MEIDLHMHSNHSDGELLPEQLVKEANIRGVSIMAITDHDEISGYLQAKDTANKLEIAILPAVEFNTDGEQGELHIIGYGLNPENRKLNDYICWRQKERVFWSKKIISKLNEQGYAIDWEACWERARKKVIVRTHIADELVHLGYFLSSQSAYETLLIKGTPAYTKREGLSAAGAIELIHQCGGDAFLAHPGIYHWDWSLKKLVNEGLNGIEVYYSRHDFQTTIHWGEQANKYQLSRSVGSDFHGPTSRSPFPIGSVEYKPEEVRCWLAKFL